MEKLGKLTANSDVVTEVDSIITESSSNPIATSAVYQLSSDFITKLGDIDEIVTDILR